jgi:hypothetical protein
MRNGSGLSKLRDKLSGSGNLWLILILITKLRFNSTSKELPNMFSYSPLLSIRNLALMKLLQSKLISLVLKVVLRKRFLSLKYMRSTKIKDLCSQSSMSLRKGKINNGQSCINKNML